MLTENLSLSSQEAYKYCANGLKNAINDEGFLCITLHNNELKVVQKDRITTIKVCFEELKEEWKIAYTKWSFEDCNDLKERSKHLNFEDARALMFKEGWLMAQTFNKMARLQFLTNDQIELVQDFLNLHGLMKTRIGAFILETCEMPLLMAEKLFNDATKYGINAVKLIK